MATGKSQSETEVPDEKTLALSDGSNSLNAYCLSSYGAFMAVCQLSPSGIREVFCHSNPAELEELADSVLDNIKEHRSEPEKHEGEIKDLFYKREVLLSMAEDNAEANLVTGDDEGKFRTSLSEE